MSIRLGKNTFIAGRVNTESLLDSPVFTGTPTTPTPNEGDNSKTVANTEFVQKELESKADSSTVYTKEEVDAKLGNVSVDLTDYYNKEEIDTKLENIDVLPDQTNNANKVLATNGTETSWQYTSIYRDLDNSTEVNSSQIVINTLSKETYNSMKEAGTLVDTELYMINDETPIPTKISELENDVGYLTSQVDISGKADKETTYTKEEVDTLFDNYIPDVSGKADITYVDEELELKADKETTYTKTEVDTLIETSVPNIQGGDYIDVVLPENITYYEYNGLDMPSLGKMSNNITISLNTFGGNNINLISDCTQVDTPVSEMYMLKLPESEVEYIQPLLKMDGTHYKLYEIISDTIYQAFGVTELTKENKNAVITQMVGTNVDVDCDTYILKAQFIDGNTNETRNILSTIYQDLNGDYIVGMYGLWDIEPINTVEVAPTDSSITIDWNDTAIKKIEDLETLTATINTKADKETTYTKTEVDAKVSSVYRFKGSVANYDALPTTDLVIGDVYNIESNGSNYAWDGNDWDKLSETIDLTPYLTKTEASTTYETIANVSSTKQELINAINLKADKSTTYTKTEVDGLVSPKADKTYVDEQLELKADKSTLATVATSGSYTDLSNTPVNVSAFLNDKNYVTVEDLNTLGFLNQEQVDEIVTKNKTALTYWD